MARMFQNDFSRYFLLDQTYSSICSKLLPLKKSLLIPAVFPGFSQEYEFINDNNNNKIILEDKSFEKNILNKATKLKKTEEIRYKSINYLEDNSLSRSEQVYKYLNSIVNGINRKDIRLRIKIDDTKHTDFEIAWEHDGYELLIYTPDGRRHKPNIAVKEIYGNNLPIASGNVARKIGIFIDISKQPPENIISYSDLERALYSLKDQLKRKRETVIIEIRNKQGTYFDEIDVRKQRKIFNNIINKKNLWKVFLQKKKLSSVEFKQLYNFPQKAIAGFMKYITDNDIAYRHGDLFTLNDRVVAQIEELLELSNNFGE